MGYGDLHVDKDDPAHMFETGHVCTDGDCGSALLVKEVVMLIQVVIPQTNELQQLVYSPFEGAEGAFVYEPFFFHDGCWANIEDSLSSELEEVDCRLEHDQYSFGTCDACGKGLRVNEPIALLQMGEFEASSRQPDDAHNQTFKPYVDEPQRFCLSCIRVVNTELMEMWDHISYAAECADCTRERNWRTGVPCIHVEPEET